MTRLEAVQAIVNTWNQRDSEFCVGHSEYVESEKELEACLLALGVTVEERRAANAEYRTRG